VSIFVNNQTNRFIKRNILSSNYHLAFLSVTSKVICYTQNIDRFQIFSIYVYRTHNTQIKKITLIVLDIIYYNIVIYNIQNNKECILLIWVLCVRLVTMHGLNNINIYIFSYIEVIYVRICMYEVILSNLMDNISFNFHSSSCARHVSKLLVAIYSTIKGFFYSIWTRDCSYCACNASSVSFLCLTNFFSAFFLFKYY
jgi:hypothetical protein